jgi:WXG100 family type VII secretion target
MTGSFNVDHATLHTAANDVRATRAEVEDQLKQLWDAADELAIAWKGSASAGFQRLFQRWDEDAKALVKAMNDIADLLDKSGTTHQVNDEQQQQLLDRIHSTLNP